MTLRLRKFAVTRGAPIVYLVLGANGFFAVDDTSVRRVRGDGGGVDCIRGGEHWVSGDFLMLGYLS